LAKTRENPINVSAFVKALAKPRMARDFTGYGEKHIQIA
jgi:hypothetical protein